jgi:hypothetical protein
VSLRLVALNTVAPEHWQLHCLQTTQISKLLCGCLHAGKLFKQARSNMNAAGKALASQVQQMQQQRAALRSGGTSSPAASPVHSAAQPSFAS